MAKKAKIDDINILADRFLDDPTNGNFNALYKRIKWGLRNYIFKIVHSNEGTDFVLNKTMESIYFKRGQFNKDIAKFSTWIYKIALNYSLKYVSEKTSKKWYKVDTCIDELYDSTMMENSDNGYSVDLYSKNDEPNISFSHSIKHPKTYNRERIIADMYDVSISCINLLPENLQVVMKDRYVNNKRVNTIAEDNNIPLSSVKNWLREGKRRVEGMIKRDHKDLYAIYKEEKIF